MYIANCSVLRCMAHTNNMLEFIYDLPVFNVEVYQATTLSDECKAMLR